MESMGSNLLTVRSASANQAVLDVWVQEYNSVRPNEAIGMKTPDDLYTKSERK